MDINKVTNLLSYIRDKYREDSVKLLRFWEFTVKKMGDHRKSQEINT